jgi:hypothetical protein
MHASHTAIVKSEKHIVSKAGDRNSCEFCAIQWVSRRQFDLDFAKESLCPLRR